jgi:hypothetical protein
VSTFKIVDNEYRTGVHLPEWWADLINGSTVFVASEELTRSKDARLREVARRSNLKLRTKRDTIDGEVGTLYWLHGGTDTTDDPEVIANISDEVEEVTPKKPK